MEKRTWVQRRLLQWYSKHRRDLPWRRTNNPYWILVSEIMLQQTQVDRVVPKYQAFLKQFPTLRRLAAAKQSRVITAWAGLGYNRRARNLHQLAKVVVRQHAGRLPKTLHDLRALPGIGPYTAAAVASFAFGAPVALVDVNVRRVLGRVHHGVAGPKRLSEKRVWALAAQHLPANAVAWNSALMDFGATVCTERAPKCLTCPLQARCKAYPAVLWQLPQRSKVSEKFADSNRFWRGKIISELRVAPKRRLRLQTLQSRLRQAGFAVARFSDLLQGLVKDGLVRITGEQVRL